MLFIKFSSILVVYIISFALVFTLSYLEFRRIRFNFNILFSIIYLLTFYLGLPFTYLLASRYKVEIVPMHNLVKSLLMITVFYCIYFISYKIRLFTCTFCQRFLSFNINYSEINLLWILLAFISIIALIFFFAENGFLLFRLKNYNQIFSSNVALVALKRFFYFFIPAMLLVYFLQPTRKRWIIFLIITITFGVFTYLIVGGTRANIFIAFALFYLIGIQRGWIRNPLTLIGSGIIMILIMFWLALKRYSLSINDDEIFFYFLYLTRDTFSPWENLATLLHNYSFIDFQGLAPIARDFYVFIPKWLWPDRPSLVLNTANYFTWKILNNHSGLAISPTLIGSLIIMGGIKFIPLGGVMVGLIIKWFDSIYEYSYKIIDCNYSSLLQAFCFGAVFNIIVLVREGLDAFLSRIVFFCFIFWLCLFIAKLLFLIFKYLFRYAKFI